MQQVFRGHFFMGKCSTLRVSVSHLPKKEVINLSLGDYHVGHFRQLFQPWRFGQPASNEDVLMLNAA